MTTRFLCIATLASIFGACSSIPDRTPALNQASSRLEAARSDPQVGLLAPDELKRADEAVQAAEKARLGGSPPASVDHLAYLARQRVVMAQETASGRAADAVTASAAAERDKLRLSMRTQEADKAERQLAAADATAVRSQARVSDLETQLKDLNAKPTPRGIVVTLGDVLFDSGKSQLMPEGQRSMAKLAEVFKQDPKRKATIEGYTDSVGAAELNLALSQRRADSVMTALLSLGVPLDRLSVLGHGEEMPVASNDTAAGRQMNRRVEIVFVQQSGDLSMR